MAYRVFGSYPAILTGGTNFSDADRANGWYLYAEGQCTNLTLEPGDIIRAKGHSAIVHYVDRDNVYVAEVWGNPRYASQNCMIAWGHFNGKDDFKKASDLLAAAQFVVKVPKKTEKVTVEVTYSYNYGTLNGAPSQEIMQDVVNGMITVLDIIPERGGFRHKRKTLVTGVFSFAKMSEK